MASKWLLLFVLLAGLAGAMTYALLQTPDTDPVQPVEVDSRIPTVAWVFEPPVGGGFVAAPTIAGDAVYLSAIHPRGLRLHGAVYAVDRARGKRRWTFIADGDMRPTASAPTLARGRLYVGEGMHADFSCRLYCLDPANGNPHWSITASDHIESTPVLENDTLYFAAGDDGVYAADALSGKIRWHFVSDLHIDSTPAVIDDKVIVGSGPSRQHKSTRVVALHTQTGKPIWQTPTTLPAWGSPTVSAGRVIVGLGNGRMLTPAQPPEIPGGAVLALDAATGETLWQVARPDAVFQRPAVSGDRVIFGCRDGTLSAVTLTKGELLWQVSLGAPVIAPPTIADNHVYAVTITGRLSCHALNTGAELWCFDLGKQTRADPLVTAGVRVYEDCLYLAAEIRTGGGNSTASLYCLTLKKP